MRAGNRYNPRMDKLDIFNRLHQAAKDGDPFAQFEMGLYLEFGTYEEQNFQKASEYYIKASDQGHRSAEGNLLLQHVLGQAKTYAPEKVCERVKQRAESGDREAQNSLGLCFQFGYGTRDFAQNASPGDSECKRDITTTDSDLMIARARSNTFSLFPTVELLPDAAVSAPVLLFGRLSPTRR